MNRRDFTRRLAVTAAGLLNVEYFHPGWMRITAVRERLGEDIPTLRMLTER